MFSTMFYIVPFLMVIFFIIFSLIVASVLIRNISENAANRKMPIESVPARVIAKREHVWGGGHNSRSHTSYYMTYELENGDRMEFSVRSDFFGMNVEGDTGILTHQGTRMINFERDSM